MSIKQFLKRNKTTLVAALAIVLSVCLSAKTAEAATYVNQDYAIDGYETYVGSIRTHNIQVMPDNVSQIYDSTENEPITRAIAHYRFGIDQIFVIPSSAQSAQGYSGGYLNGVFRYEVVFTPTYNVSNPQYIRMSIENCLVQNESLQVTCYQYYSSSGTFVFRFSVVLNNYSVENESYNRYVNMGNIIVNLQLMMDNNVESPQITWTPVINLSTSKHLTFTPVAVAGQSVAGQLYAAIENSTSVDEIVTYLSMIEDASGDINTAVAHINEYLVPQVIQHLISIGTNVANIKIDADEIVRLLTAFYNSWPTYSAQVLFYLEQLVNMNAEQSSIADEVESEYAAKASQGADLNQGMQVVTPSVDSADFDINTNIDTGTLTTLSAFWAMFPRNSIIGTMFAIAIAGIAAGFFLYGKKG